MTTKFEVLNNRINLRALCLASLQAETEKHYSKESKAAKSQVNKANDAIRVNRLLYSV